MVFPIAGGTQSTGYEVENSLRFNDDDSPQLSKDMSGLSATSSKKFTTSFWLKLGNIPQTNYGGIIDVGGDHAISLVSDNTFYFFESGGSDLYWRPIRLFRDPSAWYNIIIIADSTLSTQTDRVKIYINGVRETSFHNNSGPNQNHDFAFNTTNTRYIGRKQSTSSSLDGYLTEIHHIDGQAKAHTDFGEFDNNGVWIPIKYDGTYGNTGYYLEFKQTGTSANSSGIGADTSGNDNHFTPANLAATDVTTDTCTNNFCTWNPRDKHSGQALSEGNTKNVAANGASSCNSNFGVSQGKWYFEYKVTVVNNQAVFAVPQNLYPGGTDLFGKNYTTGLYAQNPSIYRNGSNVLSNLNGTISANDIIMWAMDLDNNNIYFGKNGQWTDGNGFDQSDFSNATAYALTRDSNDSFVVISTINGASASSYTLEMNWGNPAFAISSGNADANGYGNFEYAPPTGYYSICTKNIAEFG